MPYHQRQYTNRISLLRILSAILLLLAAGVANAASDMTVSGESIYYDDGNHSKNECLEAALQKARINALEKEFGTIVTQDITHSQNLSEQKEEERFFALSSLNVRGEWIANIGEPEYEISLDENYNYVVKCKVKGKARPISNTAVDFNARILRLSDKEAAATDFTDGQDIYLWMESPQTDLYTCVCLLDQQGTVYRLFPYTQSQGLDASKLTKGHDYILFDRSRGDNRFGSIDALCLTAPDGPELNTIFILASPNPFSAGPWKFSSETGMNSMSFDSFNSWMAKLMRVDPEMGRKQINIRISPAGSNTETINY